MISDSQVHIWAPDTPDRPWPVAVHGRPTPHREQPITAASLLHEMAAAGVDRAILVPPSWEGDRNDLANDAASSHPGSFATMGRFDPDASNARDVIKDWKKQP